MMSANIAGSAAARSTGTSGTPVGVDRCATRWKLRLGACYWRKRAISRLSLPRIPGFSRAPLRLSADEARLHPEPSVDGNPRLRIPVLRNAGSGSQRSLRLLPLAFSSRGRRSDSAEGIRRAVLDRHRPLSRARGSDTCITTPKGHTLADIL